MGKNIWQYKYWVPNLYILLALLLLSTNRGRVKKIWDVYKPRVCLHIEINGF